MFTASFTAARAAQPGLAYAYAAKSTQVGSYQPAAGNQFNGRGGAISVNRLATGAYEVSIPGAVQSGGGNVAVTAVGDDPATCKVQSWSGSAPRIVEVLCFGASGAAADQAFSLAFTDGTNLLGAGRLAVGYLWWNGTAAPTGYQDNATPGAAAPISVIQAGTGAYDVHLPSQGATIYDGLAWDGGTVMVTAYGAGPDRCRIGWWADDPATLDRVVRVFCSTASGGPANDMFALQYTGQVQP
jgi:hypothetical protein